MSKRLQVLLNYKEYKSFQQLAKEAGVSLGEWVRQALRRVAGDYSGKSPAEKIAAIRRAVQLNGPTCDIEQMLEEIERGRLQQ